MKKRYRNVAFLAELLINILVFSISCAVLVGIFGKAGQVARNTKERNFAGTEVQSLLEVVKARGAEGLELGQVQADGSILCHYTKDWAPVADADAYVVRLELVPEETTAGTLTRLAAVAQNAAGEVIFELETYSYQPDVGGEGL